MKAIRFFCNRGLLRSSGKGDSTDIGGKKPEHFTFYCKSYLLCIAMWPGRIGLTLFDLVRHRLDYMEGELPPYLTLEEAFERLEALSDVFLTRNGRTAFGALRRGSVHGRCCRLQKRQPAL